jgi:hypothetical protein
MMIAADSGDFKSGGIQATVARRVQATSTEATQNLTQRIYAIESIRRVVRGGRFDQG